MTYWLCLALDSDSPIECVLESLLVLFRLIWADTVVIWSILSTLNWPFSSHVSTERGVCLPTVSLWILFVYIEAAIRFKDLKHFHMDLCRPFAAHWYVIFHNPRLHGVQHWHWLWASFSLIYLLSSKTFQRVFTVQDAFNTVSDDMWPASLLL